MGCPCAQGMGAAMNTYDGPAPEGVPNPYGVMLHSYPTRYHGPIYTRPEFGLEWSERPNDFALEPGLLGLGAEEEATGPSAGKVIVALGLATLIVWGALKLSDSMART